MIPKYGADGKEILRCLFSPLNAILRDTISFFFFKREKLGHSVNFFQPEKWTVDAKFKDIGIYFQHQVLFWGISRLFLVNKKNSPFLPHTRSDCSSPGPGHAVADRAAAGSNKGCGMLADWLGRELGRWTVCLLGGCTWDDSF